MQERNIAVPLGKAKEWYNSDNATLKEIALQAFSERVLNVFDFTKIKSFKDALLCLYPFKSKGYKDVIDNLVRIKTVSKASAAMFKLNIIRRALNKGYNSHLTENVKGQDYTWYPYFRFVTKSSTFYDDELESGEYKKLGEITSEGITYDVLGGHTYHGGDAGLGYFYSYHGIGSTDANLGFLGCATEEIAKHFGEYFGMLVIEAMYGDMVDFSVVKQ